MMKFYVRFGFLRLGRHTPGPAIFGDPQLVGVEKIEQFRLIDTTVQDSIRPS